MGVFKKFQAKKNPAAAGSLARIKVVTAVQAKRLTKDFHEIFIEYILSPMRVWDVEPNIFGQDRTKARTYIILKKKTCSTIFSTKNFGFNSSFDRGCVDLKKKLASQSFRSIRYLIKPFFFCRTFS